MGIDTNISFMGRNNNMSSIYPQYGVFVLTSNYEGLPNALIEAMSSGLICISTNCQTGPKDLIKDGKNGFLVPVSDFEMLGQTIEKVIHLSKEERVIISNNAKETIRHFCSKKNSIPALEEVLKLKNCCGRRNE